MPTNFSSLPVVDVHVLKASEPSTLTTADHQDLGQKLYDAFSTTGFAYIVNVPLSFSQNELLELSREFFALSLSQKMKLAKKSFCQSHTNTYRGYVEYSLDNQVTHFPRYFPTQAHLTPDNLKEGKSPRNITLAKAFAYIVWMLQVSKSGTL